MCRQLRQMSPIALAAFPGLAENVDVAMGKL
jgi:hypothetical protein